MALLGQGNFSVRKEAQGVKKIYTRSQLQPITPVGDSPIGWSAVPSTFDAPPNYGNLWSSSATVDPNGVVQGVWSTPTLEEPYTSNPLDRFPFVVGTGNQYPYTQAGTDNIREIGLNPFGVSDILWRGKSQISAGWCGGIETSATYYYNLDNSKKYRISFWFKRNTWSEGVFYFGVFGTIQRPTDWADVTNYYIATGFNTFPTATVDKWYLIVGYISPSDQVDKTTDPRSGIYDPANGNMLRAMIGTPRQKEGVYKVGIMLSQYNCPTTYPEFRLWQPRIDLCDGREPSIEELLKGSPKTPTVTISGESVFKFSSGQTVPENTSITLSAELTNGATTYQWQYFRISDSTWVNLSSGTSQTYSLPHNSSDFQSTSRIQIRCTTVVAGITYTSNVLTISKVYDGIAGSNQAPLFLYQRKSTTPAKPTNTAVWTFATASYSTAPNNGWVTSIPASNGTPCWVIQAVASGNGTTDTIAPTEWSTPRVLVQDGITSTLLDLTNETTVVSVDYNGNPIGTIDTTTAIVYEGSVIGTGWTFSKVDNGCTSSIVGGLLTVSTMSADKATVTVKANKTGYSELTAVYSLTKLYPAKDGLPTPVYSLLPAHSSISKSKTGILTPATTSCKVKLSVNGQTEIIGDDPKIMYSGRNLIKQNLGYSSYGGSVVSLVLADVALVPTEWNAIGAKRLITSGGSSILKFYWTVGVIPLGIIRSSSVYVKNIGSKDLRIHSNLGEYVITVSVGESKRVLMPNITGNGIGDLQFQFRTLLASDNIDCIVYGFQTEENSYCTPFTFAPEDYKITRNGSTYTSGASTTVTTSDTDVTWALIDPKGATVDTERVPIVADGTDGTNGTSPTLLDLTNEATVVSVDYNGNPISSIETTQANVYEGNQLASGWTFTKVDSSCVSSIVGGIVTVSAMSADKATVTISATKSGYANLTAVYSLTKLYPAKDGLPTPVYSLLPAHSSISKSKTGILTPSTTSCRVKLDVNGQTEIIGDDTKLEFFGRNMISEDMMFLWNTINPTYPTIISKNEDSSYTVSYPQLYNAHGRGDVAIFNLTFKENTQYVLAIDYAQTVANTSEGWYILIYYTDGTYSGLVCLRDAIRRTQTLISTKGKTVTKITSTYAFSGSVYVYNFKVEESSYFTGFTFAPEDYKITRNGSAYTSGSSYTIGSTATEIAWSLIDPKGITVDTERVPVVVDGTDGANGNDGLNNTIVTLYQRSKIPTPEVPPARPSTGTIVYNFSNLTVSGDLAGWQIDAPTFEAGTKLFKIAASVASYTTTTSIIPSAWVGPVKTEDTEAADLLRTDMNSAISSLNGSINLKADSSTVNALGDRVSTAESNISVIPNRISLSVRESNLGDFNLANGSYPLTPFEGRSNKYNILTLSNGGVNYIKSGVTYTITSELMVDNDFNGSGIAFFVSGQQWATGFINPRTYTVIQRTFTATRDGYIDAYHYPNGSAGKSYIKWVKITEGSSSSNLWRPSISENGDNYKIGGTNLLLYSKLEQGEVVAGGSDSSSSSRVRSIGYIQTYNNTQLAVSQLGTGYDISFHFYNGTTWISGSGWVPTPSVVNIPATTTQMRVNLSKRPNSSNITLAPEDARASCRIKVEFGNKHTTFDYNQEDLKSDLSACGISISSGGINLKGNTTVVDAFGVVSSFRDGNFSTKRVVTGLPGSNRIEIDGKKLDPSISIIDSSDEVKVEISPNQIQTLAQIANSGGVSNLTINSSATVNLVLYDTGSTSSGIGATWASGSYSFVMGKLGTIITPAFTYNVYAWRNSSEVTSSASVVIALEKYNGTAWVYYCNIISDIAMNSDSKYVGSKQYYVYNIPPGTYRFKMEIEVVKGDSGSVQASVGTSVNAPFTLSYPVQKTTIGKDGIAMVWSTSQYARYAADGMEMRYGNYGLRVNNSGIQKTVNGGTWTNL